MVIIPSTLFGIDNFGESGTALYNYSSLSAINIELLNGELWVIEIMTRPNEPYSQAWNDHSQLGRLNSGIFLICAIWSFEWQLASDASRKRFIICFRYSYFIASQVVSWSTVLRDQKAQSNLGLK